MPQAHELNKLVRKCGTRAMLPMPESSVLGLDLELLEQEHAYYLRHAEYRVYADWLGELVQQRKTLNLLSGETDEPLRD